MPTVVSAVTDPEGFGKQLFMAVTRHASSQGYALGHGATADIQSATYQAAMRFTERGRALDQTAMDEALSAFSQVIDEMILEARRLPGYADTFPGIIGEQTLRAALARLCPLFPVC